jgi:hypothetical protein
MRWTLVLLLTLSLTLAACGGGDGTPVVTRSLGLHVAEAEDGDFDAAMDLAQDAGVSVVHLSLNWNDIETAPGVYGNAFLGIADLYFPARGVTVHLTLRPINTVRVEVPDDLVGLAWDDPQMILRFNQLLDFVFAQIPNVDVGVLAIGNEVDGVLASAADYAAYKVFFEATRAHARTLRPGLRVGVTAMFPGLTGAPRDWLVDLNAAADFVSVTYYPLTAGFVRAPTVVGGDFAALVALYPLKAIVLQECGYPSSPDCGGTEQMQRDFVVEVFRAWDAQPTIEHVSFFKQTDWADADLDAFLVYYGISTPEFRGFLASLGMRHWNGAAKPAWTAFVTEAAARGY